jgi:hypothetical protein
MRFRFLPYSLPPCSIFAIKKGLQMLFRLSVCILIFSGLTLKINAQYVPDPVRAGRDTTVVNSGLERSGSGNGPGKTSGRFDWSKVNPGGSFALNFGTVNFVELSPLAGYPLNDKLMLGAGITYLAFWGHNQYGRFSRTIYGGRLFARQMLLDQVFAHAELESLNVPFYLNNSTELQRKWVSSPLVGAGYFFPFAQRGGFQATLLYIVNRQPAYSPYPSNIIWRMGFFF